MTIVADAYDYVIGVDTHAAKHTLAVLETRTGAVMAQGTFPTTAAGLVRAATWITRHTRGADIDKVLVAMEGTGSYGAGFTRQLSTRGYRVTEVEQPTRKDRRGRGKTDDIDAVLAARSVTGTDPARLRAVRSLDGLRAALRVLKVARDQMDRERTRTINALTALVRMVDLGVDARKTLTAAQIRTVAAWTTGSKDPVAEITRAEAIRLATHITGLDAQLTANYRSLAQVTAQLVPELLARPGVGPVSAAGFLLAWSHPGRVHSEAAMAALAGTCPIPASSGQTNRYRLNRGGDRQLNRTITTIATNREKFDPTTKAYVARRTQEGKSKLEIRRCLKRYITRELYRLMNTIAPTRFAA
jgi:transposase